MKLDGARALAWRLGRHGLGPTSGTSVTDVVRRVVALRGWPFDLADLAVRVRQSPPASGGLEKALADGELVRSYAFRGGSYVFTPEIGAALLALRSSTRIWEQHRFQRQGGFALDDWEPFRDAVRTALADGPRTRAEIRDHLLAIPALRHLEPGTLGAGADTLYKPLHWWGDISFGPHRDGQSTFRLLSGDPRWPGLPDVDDAGRRAVALYLGAYGPATVDNLTYWLTEGLGVRRRQVLGWLADLGADVTTVSVDGVDAYALTADLDELSTAEPLDSVRLLPGFDPWVMGPGTADPRIVAPERRALATKGANLVVRRGVVSGTWRVSGRELAMSWFAEAGPVPAAEVEGEVRRLGEIQARELELSLVIS